MRAGKATGLLNSTEGSRVTPLASRGKYINKQTKIIVIKNPQCISFTRLSESMKIRNPYTYALHLYMKKKHQTKESLSHEQTVGTRSRHKRNPAIMLTVVMDFRVTRKGINILSQTTRLKNTQNNR